MNLIEIEIIYNFMYNPTIPEEKIINSITNVYNLDEIIYEIDNKDLYRDTQICFYLTKIGQKIESWKQRDLISIDYKKKTRKPF